MAIDTGSGGGACTSFVVLRERVVAEVPIGTGSEVGVCSSYLVPYGGPCKDR